MMLSRRRGAVEELSDRQMRTRKEGLPSVRCLLRMMIQAGPNVTEVKAGPMVVDWWVAATGMWFRRHGWEALSNQRQ